ncbi:MAG: hypothetical protein IKS09_04585 [Lachnospiraceae bacterium]|nr:hypothetical protein [Lachnospiraceae bacterium]
MERKEIETYVLRNDSTVLSFPDRGPWGDSHYRGNCSGWVPAYFAVKYGAKCMSEIFAGSGTTSDVCKDLGIPYIGIDLNPSPLRNDIVSMDILDDSIELPDMFYDADVCFLHPPYPSINNIHYSNNMWKDTKGVAASDIQEMSWEKGMQAVNHAIMRGYNSLHPGAYEVVLVGEIRSKGQYRSMMADLIRPTALHQTYIKLQHNTVSDRGGNTYSKSDRALTAHEMIAVFKKPSGYEIAFIVPKTYKMDIRDSKMATWLDVVNAVIEHLGEADLNSIYAEIEQSEKAKANPNWKAKVRQTLQKSSHCRNKARGVWAVAA